MNLLRQQNEKCKKYIQLDQLKKIERTKSRYKRNIKCYQKEVKKFPMYKENKKMLRVKNVIKNTLSKLHPTHQGRSILRTPSNI